MKTLMTLAILTAVSFGSASTFANTCENGSGKDSASSGSQQTDNTEKDNLRDSD